jgi:hypothetical protein
MKTTFFIFLIFFFLFVSSVQADNVINKDGYVKRTVVIKKDVGIQIRVEFVQLHGEVQRQNKKHLESHLITS